MFSFFTIIGQEHNFRYFVIICKYINFSISLSEKCSGKEIDVILFVLQSEL